MSSPFQKNFSAKSPMSPLNGAYENAADNPVYVSQAPAFADFQNQMTKISTDAFNEVDQEGRGRAQVRRADRRDERVKAGGSKVKKFLDKNKLGFLAADYKKDSDGDGVSDYKEKTAKIKAKGDANIAEGSTKSEKAFNRKQASICSQKKGYKGWDPVSGTCISE